MRNNKGFTLVELAIVLVIIGIIIGGVIKGQTLIESAKGKRVYRDFQTYMSAYNTYQDKNSAIPGDDTTTPTGSIVGSATAGQFWADLRTDNLIPAAATTTTAPNGIFGGALTLGNSAATTFGMAKNTICVPNVPGSVADSLDTAYDNGAGDTGDIRGATAIGATGSATYTTTSKYVLCFSLD